MDNNITHPCLYEQVREIQEKNENITIAETAELLGVEHVSVIRARQRLKKHLTQQ
jgi:Mn-dependent DtxR family transcriptional regulator